MMIDIMEIKVNMGGKNLTFASLAEATEWLLDLQNDSSERVATGGGKLVEVESFKYSDPEVVERTLRFLMIIKEFSPRDADSEKIMKALCAKSSKGVGARSVAVNKLLLNMGFRKGTVYRSVKKPHEPRLWVARGNIDNALAMLSKEHESLKESGALQ